MIVVNFFAPPGVGKSTTAAFVFSQLKMEGVNAELITEFAKDKTWERNSMALANQMYIAGKQFFKLSRVDGQVDVAVVDSPLPLSILYNTNPVLGEDFNKTIMNLFNSYNNMNFYINRVKEYNPKGRNQTEAESDEVGQRLRTILTQYDIPCTEIDGDRIGARFALNTVLERYKQLKNSAKL